jgi:hypothetical protein
MSGHSESYRFSEWSARPPVAGGRKSCSTAAKNDPIKSYANQIGKADGRLRKLKWSASSMEPWLADLCKEFLGERREILCHKWIESEKAAYEIGFERALIRWTLKYRSAWRRDCPASRISRPTS